MSVSIISVGSDAKYFDTEFMFSLIFYLGVLATKEGYGICEYIKFA